MDELKIQGEPAVEVTDQQPSAEEPTDEVVDDVVIPTPSENIEKNEYQTEIERLNKELAKARKERTIQRLEEKKDKPIVDSETLAKLVSDQIEEKLAGVRKEISKASLENELSKMARDPDEAELMRFYYNNVLTPTGNLKEDLENAQILANKKKLQKGLQEIQLANQNKQNISAGTVAGQKVQNNQDFQLNSEEKQLLKLSPSLTPEKIIASRKVKIK